MVVFAKPFSYILHTPKIAENASDDPLSWSTGRRAMLRPLSVAERVGVIPATYMADLLVVKITRISLALVGFQPPDRLRSIRFTLLP